MLEIQKDTAAASFARIPFIFAEYGFGEASSELVIKSIKDIQ